MFGLFKRRTELDKLRDRHAKLLEEAYELSRSNRTAADAKTAEAAELATRIETLEAKEASK